MDFILFYLDVTWLSINNLKRKTVRTFVLLIQLNILLFCFDGYSLFY